MLRLLKEEFVSSVWYPSLEPDSEELQTPTTPSFNKETDILSLKVFLEIPFVYIQVF